MWNCMREPTTVEILVGGGHDLLEGIPAESGHAILAPEIKEIRAGEVQHGIEVRSLISRRFQGKPPRAVTCLNRLVGSDNGAYAIPKSKVLGVVLAGRHLQADTERNVASAFGGPAKQPGARADGRIADAVHVKEVGARVPGGNQDGKAGRKAPARSQLIVHTHVEQVVVIFNLAVLKFPVLLFDSADKVARGRLVAITHVDIKVMEDGVFASLGVEVFLAIGA